MGRAPGVPGHSALTEGGISPLLTTLVPRCISAPSPIDKGTPGESRGRKATGPRLLRDAGAGQPRRHEGPQDRRALERVSPAEPRARRLREVMRSVRADVWVLTETDERLAPDDGMPRSAPVRRSGPIAKESAGSRSGLATPASSPCPLLIQCEPPALVSFGRLEPRCSSTGRCYPGEPIVASPHSVAAMPSATRWLGRRRTGLCCAGRTQITSCAWQETSIKKLHVRAGWVPRRVCVRSHRPLLTTIWYVFRAEPVIHWADEPQGPEVQSIIFA